MEREVCYECYIRNIEEVVVGYCVDINSGVFDDKIRKHSEAPIDDGLMSSRVR